MIDPAELEKLVEQYVATKDDGVDECWGTTRSIAEDQLTDFVGWVKQNHNVRENCR